VNLLFTHAGTFPLAYDERLLDALLRTGHAVDYQCREGWCGSCRTRLLQGTVHYPHKPLAHLNAGEILPCCCQAASPIVRLDCERDHRLGTNDLTKTSHSSDGCPR
jgi:ferredoxin